MAATRLPKTPLNRCRPPTSHPLQTPKKTPFDIAAIETTCLRVSV
jgi:hypothetical protein